MPKGTNQKFKLYRLAQIMLEKTDEEHYITMPEIMESLAEYNITADRKSIYTDLRDLSVLGIEVEGEPIGNRYHYHVVSRTFELPELKLLVDAIQSSKFITEKKSNTLIKKLEKMVSEALVFDDENFTHTPQGNIVISAFEQTLWRSEPETPLKVYQLLSGAHYRTSPLDLRRMMDAPGQYFLQAAGENEIAGALWLVDEGGLSQQLSQAVWAGFRRPRGNLVAQSLAAHGSNPLAATLRGRRVSRIAVHPARQREGTGQQLIAGALQYTRDLDYLSVSFGYTGELWRFWHRCGFVLVRMGNHREASSGCYTAMALLPMSNAGKQLAEREHYRLRRDAQALAKWNGETLPVDPLNDAVLSDDDWLELAGFAFAHRPLLTSLGCLLRLLQTSELALPALRGRLQKNVSDAQLCTTLKLSGRKMLLVRQREETAQALFALNDVRTERLRDRITQWQFFH